MSINLLPAAQRREEKEFVFKRCAFAPLRDILILLSPF
jgi:hypothetical protein